MSEPIAVVLDAEDIRLALVAYSIPLARAIAKGATIRVGNVQVGDVWQDFDLELGAVVDFERVEDAEGEADGSVGDDG